MPGRVIEGLCTGNVLVHVGERFQIGANPGLTPSLQNVFYAEGSSRRWNGTGGSVLLEEYIPFQDSPVAIGAARLRLEGVRFEAATPQAQGRFTINGVIRVDLGGETVQVGSGSSSPVFTPPFNLPNLPRP